MGQIKLGIIGLGNMGTGHAGNVTGGKCPDITLTAVADINPDRIEWGKNNLPGEITYFDDAIKMLDSGLIDACIIAVPHYDHPKYAMECMKRGINVMVEKPAGVYTKQVREMNEEADRHPEVVFGMMFNQRTNCIYRKLHEFINLGEYGEIRRVNWIITNWYRPQAYYDSGNWRATWAGEGGGVLLNQAPHNLDIWQWICGMPDSVTAFCETAKCHNIEVEDDAKIFTRYKNGATGVFITSTGEYPGTNRLEISGDKGKIVLENGTLKWWKLSIPVSEICKTSQESFACIPYEFFEFKQESEDTAHMGILQNFADAVLHGTKLIAPGTDGINELMLSNAAYMSQWKNNEEISLPLDAAEFDLLISEKIKKSKYIRRDSDKISYGAYR